MHVQLSDSGEHYELSLAGVPLGQVDRVSHILRDASLAPKFGANARVGADIGRAVHDLIRDYLQEGADPAVEGLPIDVLHCWVMFREWWRKQGLAALLTEKCVACTELGYGGMVDLLAVDEWTAQVELIDWKTSKTKTTQQATLAYRMQLAGYTLALNEMGLATPDRARTVSLAKDSHEPYELVAWATPEACAQAMQAWRGVVELARYNRMLAGEVALQADDEVVFA